MAGLPRELVKWLQSLDLTWQVKVPKWDLSNGYLVAEIFSWYFPRLIEMHNFNTGKSLQSKLLNWDVLKVFIKKEKLDIPEEFIEATIHSKEGGAVLLIERIYEILTNREVKKLSKHEVDFTDRAYQAQLLPHARSTAAQAIKNNIRSTELDADKSLILAQQKTQNIIGEHIEHRRDERIEDPARFSIRPTLGERCPRRHPLPHDATSTMFSEGADDTSRPAEAARSSQAATPVRTPTGSVKFKEIQVRQHSVY